MAHALLSPSAASRWLACTPSARFEQQFEDKGSSVAEEGTLAHALAELELLYLLQKPDDASLEKARIYHANKAKIAQSEYYTSEMQEYIDDYVALSYELYLQSCLIDPLTQIHLEHKIDLTRYVPEAFGTGDVVIISNEHLYIIDLKYGKGVPVSAVKNKQLMLYALGLLTEYEHINNVRKVTLMINQPRLNSVTEYEISVTELLEWAETELKPKSELAFKGEGDFIPGNHCQFCKARGACKALADYNLSTAFTDVEPNRLSLEETADILLKAKMFKSWLSDVEDYALSLALSGAVQYPGLKLVEGRSVRKYGDEERIIIGLHELALKESEYLNTKLKGITELEKILGKTNFKRVVEPNLIKPPGAPTLVPIDDKRQPLDLGALEAFKDLPIYNA